MQVQIRVNHAVLSALIVVCALPAVCQKKPAEPANYWPLKLGSTWTLSSKVGAQTITQVVTVTDVKKDGAGTLATLDYRSGDQRLNMEVYRVTPTGITRVSGGANNTVMVNPPIPIIQYPLKSGSAWSWSGEIVTNGAPIKAASKFTVLGPVNIKTPAGTFKAMHVHSELVMDPDRSNMKMPNDYWFAPGVGMVRQEANIAGTKITGELTSYKLK